MNKVFCSVDDMVRVELTQVSRINVIDNLFTIYELGNKNGTLFQLYS